MIYLSVSSVNTKKGILSESDINDMIKLISKHPKVKIDQVLNASLGFLNYTKQFINI